MLTKLQLVTDIKISGSVIKEITETVTNDTAHIVLRQDFLDSNH